MSTNAQRLLEADLAGAPFRAGMVRGDWALSDSPLHLAWPYLFTEVAAAPRANGPERWLVRWDVTNYGSGPITGAFWDAEANAFLPKERWPKARPGSVVASVFKTAGWAAPGQGFYHPWDRTALAGHAWADRVWAWKPEVTIAEYNAQFHRWLTSEDYLGQ